MGTAPAMAGLASRLGYTAGQAFREMGLALDRVGCSVMGASVHNYQFNRSRPMMNLFDKVPQADKSAFIAPTAEVIGQVTVGEGASIWPGCVVRGDTGSITVGANSNIQDRTVVSGGDVTVGEAVTVGHGCVISGGCELQDEAFVGMGAILGGGVVVESKAMVAAGAVVSPGAVVPSGEVWAGNPAAKFRQLSDAEKNHIPKSAVHY